MAERMMGKSSIKNPLKIANGESCILPMVRDINFVCERMLKYKEVCILTGAGVSKKSGIPTFRGDNGFYTTYFKKGSETDLTPEQFLTYQNFT